MEMAKAAQALALQARDTDRPMVFLNIGEPDFTAPPLVQAADAVELITDGLLIGAVIDQLELLFRERVPADAWPAPAQA
jgi:hypothetical protein